MHRHSLFRAIKWLYGVFFVAVFLVLLRSLGGPSLTVDGASPFDDVELGETALRRYNGQRVWVSRWTKKQRDLLVSLQGFVMNDVSTCDLTQDLCLISARTSRDGVQMLYIRATPQNLPSDKPWYGGFVNPLNGHLYDLAGRPYSHQSNVSALEIIELN